MMETKGYLCGGEEEKFVFFRLPKLLVQIPQWKELSSDAKLLYGFLLDRLSLSHKNGWQDKTGRIYLYFTIEEAGHLLGKSRPTVMKTFAALDTVKGVGLIERKKQGQGKPDKIFLRDFREFLLESSPKVTPKVPTPVPEKKGEPQEKTVEILTPEPETPPRSLSSWGKDPCPVEEKNLAPNNTKKNKPEEIKSIPLSQSPKTEKRENPPPEERERVNLQKINHVVWQDLGETVTHNPENTREALTDLLYRYRKEPEKMGCITKHLAEVVQWETSGRDFQPYTNEMLHLTTRKLYAQALEQLLMAESSVSVKGATITYAKVIEKIAPLVHRDPCDPQSISMGRVVETTVSDFIKASSVIEIKNPLAYMTSCLWSTLMEGEVKSELEFHYQYG